ncbi:tetratricopeptide repeat protein [Desulfoferula mesophila]|uniref:Tetratricopeptide TPR_2 repeat protein n=1 Tax=Desulfoferula mesophila TaxID=3058419 RepID=A0AAU9EHY5_9BACT|nr:hypothetical protein FAK_19300 [Desulfoferula mesophilus]
MRSPTRSFLLVLLLLAAWFSLASAPASAQETGPRLLSVELSIGGLAVTVRAGGVATVHPDAPFRVLGAKSDAWLDYGLSFRLADFPELNLNHYHTLTNVLGPRLYTTDSLELEVLKSGRKIGSVSLLVRLLPIDWLRRAAQTQDLGKKIAYTEKALALSPDDDLMIERLADLYAENGQYGLAAELLSSHGRSQKDPRWMERLADLYLAAGQREEAVAALSKLAALRPGDAQLLGRLALLYEQLERWEEAAVLLERLSSLQNAAERAQTLARLAKAQESAGQADRALASLERAVVLDPARPALWQQLARLRGGAGDQAGALRALERAAALSPRDANLHLRLSQVYLAEGKPAKAAVEMEKVAALDPLSPTPLLNLAQLYEQIGDRPALAGVYQRLRKLQPDDPDLAYNLAVLAMEEGKPEEALELLATVEKARPDDADVREVKLRLLLSLQRWDQAMELAGRLLEQKPHDLDLWIAVLDQTAESKPDLAATLLNKVLAQNPDSVRLYTLKAALALDAKDPQAAVKALDQAVKLEPKDLKLKFQLAGLLEAEDRDAEALELYEAILDADPAFPQAEERYLSARTRQLRRTNPAPAKP